MSRHYAGVNRVILLGWSSILLLLVAAVGNCSGTNGLELIWYERDSQEPHYYHSGEQSIPEDFISVHKIAVNQKLPVLWGLIDFTPFVNLESLAIDGCEVREIRPKAFNGLIRQNQTINNSSHHLVVLSLTQNNIREIRKDVFNFLQISHLNLSHNEIHIIAPGAFDNMPNLDVIVLDFNELGEWNNDWFFNCPNLQFVMITHNFLEEIPDRAFKNFEDSDDGEDSSGSSEAPGAVDNMNSNETGSGLYLYFSYNKIKVIRPNAFENLESLGDLYLDWNELEEIDDDTFRKLRAIERLNLNGNSIKCLSNTTIDIVLDISALILIEENPLDCDCLNILKQKSQDKKKLQAVKQSSDDECD